MLIGLVGILLILWYTYVDLAVGNDRGTRGLGRAVYKYLYTALGLGRFFCVNEAVLPDNISDNKTFNFKMLAYLLMN